MQRSDIIQAAAQIFRQKGYHATSMQDIADAVELQKPSLYHHVQSKQDILVTILDESLDLLVSDLEAVIAANGGAEWQLRRAIHAYVERLVENADLATVLLLEHRSLQPELRARHIRKRDKYESLWRGIIAQGVRMGVFRPVDEAVAAFALLGVMNWMITWYRPHGRYLPSQLADQFADLFLKGLLTAEELEPHARSA